MCPSSIKYEVTTFGPHAQENSFAVRGPRLFNAMPVDIRNYVGDIDGFKRILDVYLAGVPDRPCLPGYPQPAASNSLLDQIVQLRVGLL